MKFTLTFLSIALCIAFTSTSSFANNKGTLIFEDNFERKESQEKKDEIGNGWGTNSRTRAKGNKQVDLRDGAMYIYIHETADHAVSVTHPAEFKNGSVHLRFMLENPKDTLSLNFADLKFKKVHAGHLFATKVGINRVEMVDHKTGGMDLQYRDAKKSKTLTPAQKKFLRTKKKFFPTKLKTGKWYDLSVDIEGDTFSVTIDGKQVASFTSEGVAHPTKRMLRIGVAKQAVVDDVKIYSLAN